MSSSVAASVTEIGDVQVSKPNFVIAWQEGRGVGYKPLTAHETCTPNELAALAGREPGTAYAIYQLVPSGNHKLIANNCVVAAAYLKHHCWCM